MVNKFIAIGFYFETKRGDNMAKCGGKKGGKKKGGKKKGCGGGR